MKQEKAVLAPRDCSVTNILKIADYKNSRKMIAVQEGELIMEIDDIPLTCSNTKCAKPLAMNDANFCPHCGTKIEDSQKVDSQENRKKDS